MKMLIPFLVPLLLSACGSPGVIQTGPNSYMLSRMSAAGAFVNRTKLKYDVIREANAFAASKGKVAEGITSSEVRPAPGQMPSFDYQFRLVDPGKVEDARRAVSSSASYVEVAR